VPLHLDLRGQILHHSEYSYINGRISHNCTGTSAVFVSQAILLRRRDILGFTSHSHISLGITAPDVLPSSSVKKEHI